MATGPGRREGRKAEQESTESPSSKPAKEGEGVLTSAHLLAKMPLSLPLVLFPYVPHSLPGSRSQDEPLHSPRCHKHRSRSQETKGCPPSVLRKGAMDPEDGRDADGEQRNGVQEGGIRAGGDSALAG